MDKAYRTTLRLDPDNSNHVKAYGFIKNRDKAKGSYINDYIVACILVAEEGVSLPNSNQVKELIKEALNEYDKEKKEQSYL